MTPKDEILERIKKILTRTSEAGCTQAEAEAAMAKASKMLAEHNLTMEEVVTGSAETFGSTEVMDLARWTNEDNVCAHVVANNYFVKPWFSHAVNGRRKLMFFGKPENVQAAVWVWGALRRAYTAGWDRHRVVNRAPASDRRLFIVGMLNGFNDKLAEERKSQAMERDLERGTSGGTEIVLKSISDKTLEAYRKTYPNHTPTKSRLSDPVGNRSSLEAGYAAGRNLTLNRTLGHATRKGIQ